jgi:flagellar hook-associated protein 2
MTTSTAATTGASNVAANNGPTSIAANSSAAAAGGSVINVSSLVSQLVAATQAPQTALINSKTQAVTAEISSVGTLKSTLSTFQSSLSTLATPSSFNAQTASSSNSAFFTATATSGAPIGSYSIGVTQLASAEQLLSGPLGTDGTAATGTGTLQLSLGTTNFAVTVDSTDNSLDGIAAAINSAAGNPGITATVLNGSDGAHLVLSSTLTGLANTIAVTETDGGTGLSGFTYGTGNTANYAEESQPLDAEFTVAGVPATSPSNTVANALSGVTLTLTGVTPAKTPATLTVSTDTATIEQNIGAFVTAYNTMAQGMATLGGYDSATSTAGAMMGDPLFTGIQSQIQNQLYSIVNTGSSTYNSLASIGITTNSDGSLSLNSAALSNALSTNFGAVSQLFSGASGVASGLNTVITQALSSTGSIASRSQTLVDQENALTEQTSQLNNQMAQLSASLTQQYSALNTLLSSLQTTSAYLTQAFASLPQVQEVPTA